jgi:uncharacterized protein YdiU (UPF0061 family)
MIQRLPPTKNLRHSHQMKFDNTYFRDLEGFYASCDAVIPVNPKLIKFNNTLANELGLDITNLNLTAICSGAVKPNGAETLAQAYAGHQFGNFSPQLGDGRALLLGEILTPSGVRFDIQLKGSGPTVFSRNGDGKAGLGPVLREYLVAEAMHALGVPTARALAATTTGERIQRATAQTGAVLTRTASSHIRVGTFQFFAARQEVDKLRQLADYTINRHYPEATRSDNPYLKLLEYVTNNQAYLISKWMGIGFIHGVMNTDNVTLSGETIDYGPCAFMDYYDANAVFSSIDKQGRYAYSNQPILARWNVARLAEALIPLIHKDADIAIEKATQIINNFSNIYESYWLKEMRRKFGFKTKKSNDAELFDSFFETMKNNMVDFTLSFRALAELSEGNPMPLRNLYVNPSATDGWIKTFKIRILSEVGIAKRIRQENPIYTPRNHLVEAAINAAEIDGDYAQFEQLLEIITNPFIDKPGKEIYAKPPLMIDPNYKTFCGT